jgi:hypothetical protein
MTHTMYRALFLAEGSSDDALKGHVEAVALEQDVELHVTAPDLSLLPRAPGRTIDEKLEAALRLLERDEQTCDLIVVHRDADGPDYRRRVEEISRAVGARAPSTLHVPVVPVTMTEAWLLVDERAIRKVAGNPGGRMPLNLPKLAEVERHKDPKDVLKNALSTASGLSGRRLSTFKCDFGHHRRALLETLDRSGDVTRLPSWQRFVDDIVRAVGYL